MKRLLTLIILIAYLTVSSGAIISVRYCLMDKGTAKNTKACCKKLGKMGCCKTDSKLVKIQDSHQLSTIHFTAFSLPLASPLPQVYSIIAPSANDIAFVHFIDSSPPGKVYTSLCIRNCTFLI